MKEDSDIDAFLSRAAASERAHFIDPEFVARVELKLAGRNHISRMLPAAAAVFACVVAWPLLGGVMRARLPSQFLSDALLQANMGLQEAALWLVGSWSAAAEGGLTLGLVALAMVFATWTFASD